MKNNFAVITETELTEVEDYSTKQNVNQEKLAMKGNHIIRHDIKKATVAGYGSCRACDCKGYISKHNGSHECKTCNHHYDRHN
jgi:hypothetical protein